MKRQLLQMYDEPFFTVKGLMLPVSTLIVCLSCMGILYVGEFTEASAR